MINVKEILLSAQYSVDFIFGRIVLNDTNEDISDYQIDLYKSDHPADEFTLLRKDMDKLTFLDYGVNLKTLSLHYYYKVIITERSSGDKYESEVFAIETREPDAEAFYLMDVYRNYLEATIDNPRMVLLGQRHEGQRCTCYNPIRKSSQSPNCNICFGTTYTGGYYPPEVIRVSFANAPGQFQEFNQVDVGEKKTPLMLWTTNFPLIQNEDILVDVYNNRYRVTSWQPSYKRMYLIRQTIQLVMIPKSHQIYALPINLNALKM